MKPRTQARGRVLKGRFGRHVHRQTWRPQRANLIRVDVLSNLFRATTRAWTAAADDSPHVENPELDNLARPRVEAIENALAGECTSARLVLAGRDEPTGSRSDLSTPSVPLTSYPSNFIVTDPVSQ
jgi:hypothetical protein